MRKSCRSRKTLKNAPSLAVGGANFAKKSASADDAAFGVSLGLEHFDLAEEEDRREDPRNRPVARPRAGQSFNGAAYLRGKTAQPRVV